MFRNIGGLQNAGIAYDKCLLKPYFFADSCSTSAKTETPNGMISFAWKKTGSRFVADVVIPEGTDAILELPGRAPVKVHTGKLEFQL